MATTNKDQDTGGGGGVGGGAGVPWHLHFNSRAKQGPTVSFPNINDIVFSGVQKI